ncbi:MAG: hypothetical protein Kow0042_10870 [Calditrichia bacterium]
MNKDYLRKILIRSSDLLESGVKKLRGAANRLSPQKSLTLADCERQNWANVRTAFVLSTGRSGTLLLNHLFLLSAEVEAHHQPRPELIRASRRAYEEIREHPEIFRETLKSSREELVLAAAQRDKLFLETNNRITFFAPVIPDVFPNSLFIHLVRHPGDFVRSGIRRKWYSGQHDYDLGRIVPVRGEMKDRWPSLSVIEKIGWLWNETNQFIEDFRQTVPAERFLFIKAEELFAEPEVTHRIFDFLQISGYNRKAVEKIIRTPVNVQKKGRFAKFEDWPEEDKQKLKLVTPLAERYGYFW